MHEHFHDDVNEISTGIPESGAAAINFQNYRAWHIVRNAYAPRVTVGSAKASFGERSAIEIASAFYFEQKFAENPVAQALAKANIERHKTITTLDDAGRFAKFELTDEGHNAQLQCFELFPRAGTDSSHPLASVHHDGYQLSLRWLGYIEYERDRHRGLTRLAIRDENQRLTETERNRRNAVLAVSLTNASFSLSEWEKNMLRVAMGSLRELFGC
jgi:hypothetical protein